MASFAYRRCRAEMQELREIGKTLLAIRSRPLLKLRLWQYVGRLRSRVSAIAYRSRPASPSQQRLHCASAGQLLQAAAKSGEKHRRQSRHDSGIETLADSGVSEKQSVEWQKLTKAPDAEFEAALAPQRNRREGITVYLPQIDCPACARPGAQHIDLNFGYRIVRSLRKPTSAPAHCEP
jgi:hypothetical protein